MTEAQTMKKITCYGTGVIGTAWGAVFLKAGYHVWFYDIDESKLTETRDSLKGVMQFFQTQGMLTADEAKKAMEHASYTVNPEEAVKDAGFIQENCPENVSLKQKVLEVIEQFCPADAIIASSTSGLMVSDIAANAKHPERVIVGHPYNPVYMMPLVEISKSEKTGDEYVQKAYEFYREIGKEPVILHKETPGFICNRIQIAVLREAMDLVRRGVCSVEDVDKAVVYGVGLRWAILGPHLVNQLGGGKGGFRALNEHLADAASVWLKDMAKWTEYPKEYTDTAEKGIALEMQHRTPGTGQNMQELGAYLNNGIIAILKYHGKL